MGNRVSQLNYPQLNQNPSIYFKLRSNLNSHTNTQIFITYLIKSLNLKKPNLQMKTVTSPVHLELPQYKNLNQTPTDSQVKINYIQESHCTLSLFVFVRTLSLLFSNINFLFRFTLSFESFSGLPTAHMPPPLSLSLAKMKLSSSLPPLAFS